MKNKIEVVLSKRGYVVSEDGILYNPKGKRIGYIDNTGYYICSIRYNKKIIRVYLHRLQAYQKYGNKLYDKNVVTRHLNGNKLDNSWDNIVIGTQSDNIMDIPEQIRIKKAVYAASHLKKHNDDEIKEYYKNYKSYKKTMERFNISSKGTLHYILNKNMK